MARPRKSLDEPAPRQKQGPWFAWVSAIRWTPWASLGLEQRYAETSAAEDRDAFLLEAAPEFVAFLSGRAYRLKHGPKPFVPEWSLDGNTPRAAALGLYGGLGAEAQRTLQVEWEEGWMQEHQRLKGKRV